MHWYLSVVLLDNCGNLFVKYQALNLLKSITQTKNLIKCICEQKQPLDFVHIDSFTVITCACV